MFNLLMKLPLTVFRHRKCFQTEVGAVSVTTVIIKLKENQRKSSITSQVAQARYMSSSMLTFASFRNSSDLHIYKDLYGK